jgi:hypothetical protein
MRLRSVVILAAVGAAASTCAKLQTAFNTFAQQGTTKSGAVLRIQQKGKDAWTVVDGPMFHEDTTPFAADTLYG